jgi:hypothetical protein
MHRFDFLTLTPLDGIAGILAGFRWLFIPDRDR